MQKVDLDGDGKTETVSLLGQGKQESTTPVSFTKQVIRIEKDGNQQDIELKKDQIGMLVDISVNDVTGDGKKEIACQMRTGNEGKGTAEMSILTPGADGKYQEMSITKGRNPEFRIKLLNNDNYEVDEPVTNRYWTLQLDEDKIKQTGNPNMTANKLGIDSEYEWSLTDTDNDGKVELSSKRPAWFSAKSNSLLSIQTVYKWDGQTWKASTTSVSPEKGVQILK